MFYLDLFGALAQHDVRYVVVGGLALNLHGVERATMDVDLVIALDAPNLGAAIDAFDTMGLVPVAPDGIAMRGCTAARSGLCAGAPMRPQCTRRGT